MMNSHIFVNNNHARIPFSVIGILLILGSSVTSVYITRLEMQKSEEIVLTIDVQDIGTLLTATEADITTAVNIAGMKALKEIGKNPITKGLLGTAAELNQYRTKAIIRDELNIYLSNHYIDDISNNGRYAINVILHNDSAIPSIENITLRTVDMELVRTTIPFLGPQEKINHPTYWMATVPLDIEIRTVGNQHKERVMTKTMIISTFLTSRFPLLESIMNEYNQSISGAFSPLWSFTTAISNLYSLIRSFKHYQSGQPPNVVDNQHLALIVNSGLLLEESLTFSSVDPLAIVDLAMQTKKTLKQPHGNPLSIFNSEMDGNGYIVSITNISEGSANVDSGDDLNESIDDCPNVNLSEIAERILYNITSVTLQFENENGDRVEEYLLFDGDVGNRINELVQYWSNQSYFLQDVIKHLEINRSTTSLFQTIISVIYQDEMFTKVTNRQITMEDIGDPGDGWMDGGVSIWVFHDFIPLLKHDVKPLKGFVVAGSPLFEETYDVTYHREHYWWKMVWENISGNLTLVKHWNNMTDTRVETVTLQTILSQYSCYENTGNDVSDILYYNFTVDDWNLQDTVTKYSTLFPDSDTSKQSLIRTQDNIGAIALNSIIQGDYLEWTEEESWDAVNEILESIASITLDSNITATQYPNPIVLLEKVKIDLEAKFNASVNDYLSSTRYQTGGMFYSVGKKAVYFIRKAYVDKVKDDITQVFSFIISEVDNYLQTTIPPDADFNAHDIKETLDNTADAIRNQCSIPFGLDMNLFRNNESGVILWNETIRLAVDQSPNYLTPFEKIPCGEEEIWTMKLRNRCTLGPTGLPILPPSPVTPWIVTINVWLIDVEGEFTQLKIIDASDETIFNPLLGHEPQIYQREAKIITVANIPLGENTRLKFGFTTVAFGVVPSWGMMVGDIQDNWFDDHTAGYDER